MPEGKRISVPWSSIRPTGEMTAAEALEAAQQQGDDLLFDYQ